MFSPRVFWPSNSFAAYETARVYRGVPRDSHIAVVREISLAFDTAAEIATLLDAWKTLIDTHIVGEDGFVSRQRKRLSTAKEPGRNIQ